MDTTSRCGMRRRVVPDADIVPVFHHVFVMVHADAWEGLIFVLVCRRYSGPPQCWPSSLPFCLASRISTSQKEGLGFDFYLAFSVEHLYSSGVIRGRCRRYRPFSPAWYGLSFCSSGGFSTLYSIPTACVRQSSNFANNSRSPAFITLPYISKTKYTTGTRDNNIHTPDSGACSSFQRYNMLVYFHFL